MKIPHKTKLQPDDNRRSLPTMACAAALLAMLAGVTQASAALFIKADNASALNTGAAWVNGVTVPGASDIAQWDSTVTILNTTNALGAGMSWSGIKIVNPAGNIQINAGGILTNGVGGIDLTTANVNLTLNNTVQIAAGAQQQWNVANGQTLSLAAIPTKPGQPGANTGQLQVGTTGTVKMGSVAATTIYDNNGNSWMTYGLNDWANLDSSGNVIAATYTPVSAAPLVAGVFNDITGDIAGGAGSAVDVPGIRFNDPAFHTLNIANSGTSRTMTCRGILVTANSGGGLIGGTAATSFIRPSRTTVANTSWNVIQNSPNDFTISAIISNGSSSAPTHLVKSGPGNLIISYPANGYTGGSDINGGTLTVAAGANLGGGAVVINAGRLVLEASNTTYAASVTVSSGCTNRISLGYANAQQAVSNVTFNAGITACGFSWANGISFSTTTAPLFVTNILTANGSIAVNIYSGTPTVGTFPLIKYTTLAGTGASAFNLGALPLRTLGYLSNDVATATIYLVVTNITEPLDWATTSGTWDTSTANWVDVLGTGTAYQEANGYGDAVVFEDTKSGSGPISIELDSTVIPGSVTADNATKNYTITGSGNISGVGSLIKTNSGTLYLQTANSFSGGIYLGGGIVNFTSLTNLGSGGVNFTGGTLQYASGNADDISVRTVWFGGNTGTIDDGGNSITFANPIGNSGPGSFAKIGSGTLTLNGTNSYTGNTIVGAGTLALGSATTYISNSVGIVVNNGATLDVSAKPAITLNGSISQTLSGSGTVNGGVINGVGATISPGDGTLNMLTMGSLTMTGGTNLLDVSTVNGQSDLINATDLTLTGGTMHLVAANALTVGTYKLISYSGSLLSGPGSSGNLVVIVTGVAQPGKSLTLSDATSGEIDLIVADTASDTLTWTGAAGALWGTSGSLNWQNGANPWAFTNGDVVTFNGTGIGQPAVSLQASVQPSSVTVNNDAGTTYTFNDGTGSGGGKIIGATGIAKSGAGTLVIATANINTGATVINAGVVQIGAGGATGDLGAGNVTNNGVLVFNQTGTHTVNGSISGTGSVNQQGSATVILAANNTYAGSTTIASGGTLQVGTGGATGGLGTGAITNDGTLVYNHTGTFSVGNIKTGPANGGALTLQGNASVTLNDGNTYNNNTAVQGGVVQLAAADSIPSAATLANSTGWLVLDGGATGAGVLDVNGFDITVNALSGLGNTVNGAITNTSASSTTNMLTVLNGGTTYNGTILGSATGAKLGLTLLGTTELRLNGNCAYAGPTYVGSGATLGVGPGYVTPLGPTVLSNNATFYMHANGSTAVFPGNAITIADNSAATLTSSAAGNGFGGLVSGGVTATNIIGPNISASSTVAAEQWAAFYGTVWVANGGSLRFSSTSLSYNGGENATFQVDGTLNTRNGSGANSAGILIGNLTGSGTLSGGGTATASTTRYNIGFLGADSIFSGAISDGSAGNTTFVKSGAGRLTLSGGQYGVQGFDENYNIITNYFYTNLISYTGSTTISNGVLALVAPAMLTTSPTITLASSTAVLDVSSMGYADSTGLILTTNPVFEVFSAQTLAGIGTIRGSLLMDSGATLNLGLPTGILTVTNGVDLEDATVNVNLDRSSVPTSSQLAAGGATTLTVNGGTLTVTNLGSDLVTGDVFHIFNKAPIGTGFTTVNLPVSNVGNTITYAYQNNLAVDGTIVVTAGASPIADYSTNITASVSGNTMTVAWPATHLGWLLELQTNSLNVGLGNNWVTNFGTATVTSTNYTVDPANGAVFYRLVHP